MPGWVTELVRKGLVLLFAIQVVADLVGATLLIFYHTKAITGDDLATGLSVVLGVSIGEAILALLALFVPQVTALTGFAAARIRLLIAGAVIGIFFESLGIFFIWGIDVGSWGTLSYLWVMIVVLLVVNIATTIIAAVRP